MVFSVGVYISSTVPIHIFLGSPVQITSIILGNIYKSVIKMCVPDSSPSLGGSGWYMATAMGLLLPIEKQK